MSRFLGPIAGIAAGLGIAALLSNLGLSGAFLEFMSSLILIALLAFAIMFIVRRLRGAAPATQSAGMQRNSQQGAHEVWRAPPSQGEAASAPIANDVPGTLSTADQSSWFIPEGFDTGAFLANAKKQFLEVQRLWDEGDIDGLSEYLTDDMVAEFRPQIQARNGQPQHTEVLLLNAELLGIEAISDGHLASVRYSGMLREESGAEAVRIEEVWNLYKADGSGWLLAGLQQLSSNNG
jgi:predicted lipid-binding transport protein (Tim44 family)